MTNSMQLAASIGATLTAIGAIAGVFCYAIKKEGSMGQVPPCRNPGPLEWNPADTKPEHPGEYRTRYQIIDEFREGTTTWNGEHWIYPLGYPCYFQNREWRELTVDLPTFPQVTL